MKTRFSSVALLVLLALPHAASAAPSAQDFVAKASIGNQFEIESSQLALQDSQNDAVKKFARQMIDDHTHIGDTMAATLAQPSVGMSPPGTSLDARHQAMLDRLGKLSGADFDHKYIDDQIKGHKEAASLFNSYAKGGDNPALKSFAAQTLPTIKQHLQHVKMLKASS